MPKMNWNTIILSLQIGIFSFLGKELWNETRSTHDAVLTMKGQLLNYDLQISDVRTRIAAVEVDIQKLKDKINQDYDNKSPAWKSR